ncbi:hypothetical protein M1328_04455 [Patescibacteria group bacterium]|nr:hypothetical protein [Patescibacteria group bacterium]
MLDFHQEFFANRPGGVVFTDWSPYLAKDISQQIPARIKYTPPKPREDLRKSIKAIKHPLGQLECTIIETCLNFLEAGSMVDDFGKEDWQRDAFLHDTKITVNRSSTDLFEFAKKVSKLSRTAIARVLGAAAQVEDEAIFEKYLKLRETLQRTEEGRGFFTTEDLTIYDELATQVVGHFLS